MRWSQNFDEPGSVEMHKHQDDLSRRTIKRKLSVLILFDIQAGFYEEQSES